MVSEYLDRCFEEVRLGSLPLRNRLIKAATFEGRSPDGIPGEPLIRFHERMGQGGVAMSTLAYCAPEPDGRFQPHALSMEEAIRSALELLVRRVQATGARVAGQLTHCGTFTKNPPNLSRRPLGPSTTLNLLGMTSGMPIACALTIPQIRQRIRSFVRAAGFMKSVGFDAIEIHFGHGYAISQFISPRSNRRKDSYGGPLANRMRFGLEVLEGIRAEVGDDYPLLAKISMSDGIRGGIDYDEGVEVAALLELGGIDAVVCSAGSSSGNPMLLFHGDSLLPGLLEQQRSPAMRLGMRTAAPFLFRRYPFQELYLLDRARRVRDRVQCNLCYVGGATSATSLATLMAEGFDFVQLGRALLYDPDMPHHLRADASYVNACTHCNRCATLIEAPGGIRCELSEAGLR